MKKIAGVLICLVALCGAGYYFFILQKTATADHYARYLSQDTLGVVSLTHLNTLTDSFPGSPLGRFLGKETMASILLELGADQQVAAEYGALYDTVTDICNNPAFRTVFGDDSVVAVQGIDLAELERNPEAEIKNSLVVFATTAAPGALDMFARLVLSDTVTSETVGEFSLTRITLDIDEVIYGLSDKGTVLLAYDPQVLVDCMAVRRSEISLLQLPSFGLAESFWQRVNDESTYSRAFLNISAFYELLNGVDEQQVQEFTQYFQGVDYIASTAFQTAEGMEIDTRAGYRYDQLHDVIKGTIGSAAVSNTSLHLLTEKTLFYDWSATLSREAIMASFSSADPEHREQLDTILKQELGVSLDELLQVLGPQYGGVLTEIVNSGFFPIPKLVLFLEIRDPVRGKVILDRLREKVNAMGMVREQREVVNGKTIYYWPVLPGEATQPALLLHDNMLYLANGRSALADILIQEKAQGKLPQPMADLLGSDLSGQLTTANSGAVVLYPKRLAVELGDGVDWLTNLMYATKGISVNTLSKEMLVLMESVEVMVLSSKMTTTHADWSLTLHRDRESVTP